MVHASSIEVTSLFQMKILDSKVLLTLLYLYACVPLAAMEATLKPVRTMTINIG